jgi:ABC-type branched-subunit amino acid transport system substrate-binding protein
VRVIVRDSAGDPATAAAAVHELAGLDEVVAIVGPVFSDEALAAAEAAEAEGVPLVTLSNREDVTQGRKFVMRTRTTPADEVSLLVNHAVDQLSAKRFGVLYPKTRYGRGMRKLYWDAIVARGGKLVTMASYAPEATDFSNVIKEMVGFRFLSAGERQALAERDRAVEAARSLPPAQAAAARQAAYETTGPGGEALPPIVDFDVLFIPDSAEAVAMIAPGLALQGVRGVRLLGSSDWLDSDLLRGADRHVAGAVISTPFYAASDVGVVREFVDEYQQMFEVVPDAYAAQGFDAASLVLQQLAARRRDREAVREGLLSVRAFPGASGSLTMLPDGNARRRPFLVEVSGQRFVPLD